MLYRWWMGQWKCLYRGFGVGECLCDVSSSRAAHAAAAQLRSQMNHAEVRSAGVRVWQF